MTKSAMEAVMKTQKTIVNYSDLRKAIRLATTNAQLSAYLGYASEMARDGKLTDRQFSAAVRMINSRH